MTSCKRAAELTSQELDHPLPAMQRFALGFHRVMCPTCRRFRTQLAEVDRAAGEFATAAELSDDALPDDARERIRQALDAATAER